MIYLDNAATTKLSDSALEQMLPFLQNQYANASSNYSFSILARNEINKAKEQIAKTLNVEASEIIFTSGGTEGNNWVIQNIVKQFDSESIHVITSSIEHHSVINVCHMIENKEVSISYLPVNHNGCVMIEDVVDAIRPNTRLVSIMLANNEIGTLQPIEEIGAILEGTGIFLHTDAVQAVGHIPIDIEKLRIDFLTASAHKFNGPKGIGFLYKRTGCVLSPLFIGGAQERGERAGTENVAGIVALGCALEENVADMSMISMNLTSLVQMTIDKLRINIPNLVVNGEKAERLPGVLNISLPNASGEAMMHLLDLHGICVSTSAACNAGKDEPSHVLLAMGLSEEQAKSSIRISYGKYNEIADVNEVVYAISKIYSKIAYKQ